MHDAEINGQNLDLEAVDVRENYGYREEALLAFLELYPREAELLHSFGLVFPDDGGYRFPSPVSPADEATDPEKKDQAFRARVGRHTVGTGRTMNHFLIGIRNAGCIDIDDETIYNATGGSICHDAVKIPEMRFRPLFQDPDKAYNVAEEQLKLILENLGYDQLMRDLVGSVGHNGAREFLLHGVDTLNVANVLKQCAYLSDVLMEETVIQADPLAKCRRLLSDPKYREQNLAGFPYHLEHPGFTFPDGTPRPKFDIQYEVTSQLADNIGNLLSIDGRNLSKYLIRAAVDAGEYDARFSSIHEFQIPNQNQL